MAAFIFNVAKGRIVELFLRGPSGGVALLEAAQSNVQLVDYDTLPLLLAGVGNTELQHASYARRTGIPGVVTVDDVLDETRVDIAPVTFPALSGNPVLKAIVFYDLNGLLIPLTCHDWPYTPDGSDATLVFA